MFVRLQIRMTLYFTLIFILIMFVSDLIIYFFMVNYNQYQMSQEVQSMLNNIEAQEWAYEEEEISRLELNIDRIDYDLTSGSFLYIDKEDEEDNEEEEDKEQEDKDDEEEEVKVIEEENLDETEDVDFDDSEEFTVPNSIYEINIPKTLNTFSIYAILSTQGELVYWKSKDSQNEEELLKLGSEIEHNERPEVIELQTAPKMYFLMSKNEILIQDQLLGYYFVGKDVTIAYETMNNLVKILLTSFVLGLFISVLLGYLVAGWTIAPIKRAYESKQDFLANVSHELRTPLSVILLSTETLAGDIDTKQEFQHEIVGDIKEETIKMSDLIEQLLLLSRSDSHKLITSKESFNFTELVRRELSSYRTIATAKGVTIEEQLQEHVSYYGDKKLLNLVVSVLLDNSIKYNREQGKVWVTLKASEKKGASSVILTVRDMGIGIPEKEYEHIFERFYRLENSRSKKTGGYGLGLSIAKEIVELHQGKIEVQSKVGEGTEFVVHLR